MICPRIRLPDGRIIEGYDPDTRQHHFKGEPESESAISCSDMTVMEVLRVVKAAIGDRPDFEEFEIKLSPEWIDVTRPYVPVEHHPGWLGSGSLIR